MPCGFGSENSDMLSTVATGDEIQDLLHFKNDGQLRTLNRCHSLSRIRNRSLNKHTHWKSTLEHLGETHRSRSMCLDNTHPVVWNVFDAGHAEYVYCWLQQLKTKCLRRLLNWNDRHTAIRRWPCLRQLNIPSGEVDRVLLKSTKQPTTHYGCLSLCLRGGLVLKLICLSPFCRHIIPLFESNIHSFSHFLRLSPLSPPLPNSFIPLLSVWPSFQSSNTIALTLRCLDKETS